MSGLALLRAGILASGMRAAAAFPSVAATATSSQTDVNATSHSVSLPSGVQAGNLLVVVFRCAGLAVDVDTPTGWTLRATSDGSGTGVVLTRVADGTEGAAITVTTSEGRRSAHHAYRITGASGSAAALWASGSTLDPPSLSPAWGSKKTLWLAVASSRRTDNSFTAAPSGYSDLIQVATAASSTASSHVRLASAWRHAEAASEDPGAFTASGTTDTARAATVAIEPA